MSQLRYLEEGKHIRELDYMPFCHGSLAVIKFNSDLMRKRTEGVVVFKKGERATPGGLGLLIESITIPMQMATTTSTTIMGAWSE